MRLMVAGDIGMGADDIAKRQAVSAILDDLRDRRFLKWLFVEHPDHAPGPIGYVDAPIDLALQHEIVTRWVEIAWAARQRDQQASPDAGEADRP